MDKALFSGTVPLDFLKLPQGIDNWEKFETEDIFATNFINFPKNYMLTLGSAGYHSSYQNIYSSLATTPAYELPTSSQFYIAGRDVIRWGGPNDPLEIDFDRYVFTPDFNRSIAIVSKAPKTEPHHLSDVPSLVNDVPDSWKEIFEAIQRGELP